MMAEESNEAMREVSQGKLPGGGRSDTGAGLAGCLGIPQSRKGHSRQEGEDRHRPVGEHRGVGVWLESRGGGKDAR